MRRALSTHLFANHRMTVALLDRILRSGVGDIEIFCARQHFDYRNRSQIDELAHWFRDADLKVHSMHAPMYNDDCWGRSGPQAVISITERSKVKRIAATDEIRRALEVADVIPFRYLVQHIGVAEEEFDPDGQDAAFASLDELRVFASQLGVEVLVENIPNGYSSADRLCGFLEVTHLPLHFCFDTGHAHMGAGIEAEFRRMKDRIRSTHVHDNNGSDDSHLFPKVSEGGTIDWESTVSLLRGCPDQTPLLLELREDKEMEKPLDQARRSFEELESL
jgi:sugar phosphate isomerase/epimerase